MMSMKKPPPIKRDNPDLRTLGRRLRELRGFDLTQGELAKELGISQSQLSKYERGVAAPPADILFFIKQRFQVSIDWLLTGRGLKESNTG
jgi:transcriptional regulator with XRE-family HTH domain